MKLLGQRYSKKRLLSSADSAPSGSSAPAHPPTPTTSRGQGGKVRDEVNAQSWTLKRLREQLIKARQENRRLQGELAAKPQAVKPDTKPATVYKRSFVEGLEAEVEQLKEQLANLEDSPAPADPQTEDLLSQAAELAATIHSEVSARSKKIPNVIEDAVRALFNLFHDDTQESES